MEESNFSQGDSTVVSQKSSSKALTLLLLVVVGVIATIYIWDQWIKEKYILVADNKSNILGESKKLNNTSLINYLFVSYTKNNPSAGVFTSSLKSVNTEGASTTVVSYSDENIYLYNISPDERYAVIGHYNRDKHGGLCLFCLGKTGLTLIGLDKFPYEIRELVPPGVTAQSDFSWSSDSKYLSYLVDEGKELQVMDVDSGKVIINIKSKGTVIDGFQQFDAQPIFWLDQNNFSYILDSDLHLGSLNNPQGKIIATGADNSVLQFEGPSTFVPLDWSPNRKYVSYFSTSSLLILNTESGKKYQFARNSLNPYDYANGSEYIPETTQLGWRNDNEYLFYDVNGLRAVVLPEGKVKMYLPKESFAELSPPLLSNNTNYVYTEGSKKIDDNLVKFNGNPFITFKRFFNLFKKDWQCTINNDGSMNRGNPFVDNRDHTWAAGDYALLKSDSVYPPSIDSGIVHVIDLNLCKEIGVVKGTWPTYESVLNKSALPSVLDIVAKVKNI